MKLTPLRSFCMKIARSTAISDHAPQPRDSSRLSAWLKLRRIDTGAGPLRLDAKFGGVVIAEVQADLGQHGVTIESTPEQKLYQDSPEVTIVGTGFNETFNLLRWANGLRGKGVNVNCVMPSIIDTPENRSAMPAADPNNWVSPEKLANVILFLCSEEASAVHGACIPVIGLS